MMVIFLLKHGRSKAMAYLSEHQDNFEGFITQGYSIVFNSCIHRISQDDHCADNPIIRATAYALNVETHLTSSA